MAERDSYTCHCSLDRQNIAIASSTCTHGTKTKENKERLAPVLLQLARGEAIFKSLCEPGREKFARGKLHKKSERESRRRSSFPVTVGHRLAFFRLCSLLLAFSSRKSLSRTDRRHSSARPPAPPTDGRPRRAPPHFCKTLFALSTYVKREEEEETEEARGKKGLDDDAPFP